MSDQDQYYAGFMTAKPRFDKRLKAVRRRAYVFLADLLAIVYFWTLASYCWNITVFGTRDYVTLPWWIMLVVAIEAAAVWENFGVSLGMRLLGLRLMPRKDQSQDNLGSHFLRYLLWHLGPVWLVGSIFSGRPEPWHERVTDLHAIGTAEAETEEEEETKPWYRASWKLALLALLGITIWAAIGVTDINFYALFTNAHKTGRIWSRLLRPNFALAADGMRLLIVTIYMALMATIFGVLAAVPLSFVAARNLSQGIVGRAVYTVVRVALSIARSIDAIIWAIIFLVWVRVGAFPGVLALFVQSLSNLTKLYSERLESIDPGPVEAIRAAGGNRLQVVIFGIIPQIVNPYLSFTLYQWDINVRFATVIGIVGGGGIGQSLYQYMKVSDYRSAGMMMLLIMLTVWAIDYMSSRLRARLA